MPLSSGSFDDFHNRLQAEALKGTKTSAGLPSDIGFYKTLDDNLSSNVAHLQSRVLSLIGGLVSLADGKGKEKSVAGEDVVDDLPGTVVDSMDVLLERTDICLDEYSGKLKRPAATVNEKASKPSKKADNTTGKGYLPPSLQHASGIQKPQTQFPIQPNNSDQFSPPHSGLKHKYNAKVPLGYVLQPEDLVPSYTQISSEDALLSSHPYYYETTHSSHPSHVFNPASDPIPPPPLSDDILTYVSTEGQFEQLLAHLESPEVDLEHHSYRTYRGFLCLMQISTRTSADFVVDLLVPSIRKRMHELNAIFTDPSKIKVFHGAESDIVWLQQDFNIYVVGLFDTFHCLKTPRYLPRHSLSTLLSLYCDVNPDKKYQTADWRIRPLPKEMLEYAQSDTHFLLYIYDCVRSGLIDKAKSRSRSASRSGSPLTEVVLEPEAGDGLKLLKETLERSNMTSLRLYAQDVYDVEKGSGPGGWDTMARKWNKGALVYVPGDSASSTDLAPVYRVQRNVYRALHLWRDKVAREEDESTVYVLPNHWLFPMSESPPTSAESLLGGFRGNVPVVVKRRVRELVDVVKDAVRRGLEEKRREEEVLVMEVEQPLASLSPEHPDLFGAASNPHSNLNASSSSLFTGSKSQARPIASSSKISTSSSFLFGHVIKHATSTSGPSDKPLTAKGAAFQEILGRINSTLVIAPSVSVILASSSNGTSNSTASSKGIPIHTEPTTVDQAGADNEVQVEADPVLGTAKPIAYVPASQRTTIPQHSESSKDMEDMGPIVVVGRKKAGGKKRKRAPGASAPKRKSETGDAVPAQIGDDGQEEAFDFTNAPNVLDGNRRAKEGSGVEKEKKGKGKKKGTNFFGDFPAPPKARNEVKSGNVSVTFRSGK
ncbi:ribonuclease H-like domain-containing protein [Coprinopsis sp. MPI-PUGE-AT-0042]|nr:ribonuclease H-like domain-containing protein [Coprinopsis sp. MPI-PUGE-AT-0042]